MTECSPTFYDADSRLTSVKQGTTSVASYAYDAQGRRKSKTVGSTSTVFVTDTDNREVLEYDGSSGAAQRWYAFGQGRIPCWAR
jgi:YD repeat-containing protein